MATNNFFKNKTVLITGASQGLGKALAIELVSMKADLILVDKSKEILNKTIQEITQANKKVGKLIAIAADLSTKEGCENAIRDIKKTSGMFDILINNAAILKPGKFSEKNPKDIIEIINTNLLSTMILTNLSLPILAGSKKPGIINICGFFGKVGVPYFSLYSAAEFGIAGFTESLQREYAGENLRIMGVYTAGLKTDMFKGMIDKMQKIGFIFENPEIVAKKIVTAYNEMKNDLVLGKKEKSLIFWNGVSKGSNDKKFKKIKTKLLNTVAAYEG
ncbi:MAG TPA: SDR family oxidoreductase [Spirochaetota bacterium]|nr:SDR family oxidoreductase [Spirochaetota bacterium]HOL56594.1 SDR family oxidoreductase [Spirochaetota bacterium]HPP04017.1 SDR family oxidoreductase [Spirochaetota bacterium]